MKTRKISKIVLGIAVGAALAAPGMASAEQTTTSGGAALSTAARLDFSVVIGRFLRLRVGTATATIDQITFTVPGVNVGDGSNIAGTGGDAAGTGANVMVQSNSGQVTITATNNSAGFGMGDGAGHFIPYTEILVASTVAQLPSPTLNDAGGTTSQPTFNAGQVTNRLAVWNYTYKNTAVYSAGTYGTSANGGRVTYTAVTP